MDVRGDDHPSTPMIMVTMMIIGLDHWVALLQIL